MRHPLDLDRIYQDIFVLLHLIYGAEEYAQVHDTSTEASSGPVEGARYWTRLETQVAELLVSIAIRSRIIFERASNGQSSADAATAMENGYFMKDNEDDEPDESILLTPREACNKILHAESIDIQRNKSGSSGHYWNGIVTLEGTHYRKAWRVCLFVNSFLANLSRLLESLQRA
jgi:hypothetical protein